VATAITGLCHVYREYRRVIDTKHGMSGIHMPFDLNERQINDSTRALSSTGQGFLNGAATVVYNRYA
jgi:hypothetical protein